MLSQLTRSVVSFLKRDDGPTAVEYAVMLALIMVVCIGAIGVLGNNANGSFGVAGNAAASPAGS
jgi:pilus assembly protein Flp/PilA